MNGSLCLGHSSSYRWVEDSRQNVRLIVLPSPRLVCSPLPEEFVLVDRISSSLEFARWNSDCPLPVYLTLRHFKSTTTRSLDNTADSLQQAALNHSIDRQFFPRQLSQSSLNFLESDLNV